MVVVLESAMKHGMSEDDVRTAWENVQEYRTLTERGWPPHYMAVGFLSNGKSVELIAYSEGLDWFVFHAMSPVTGNFKRLYEKGGR